MTTSMGKMKNIFYALLDKEINRETALREIEKIKKNKLIKGYIYGMKGITNKKRKKYSINTTEINKERIRYLQKIIRGNLSNPFLPDFEKGYFIAWKDYLNYLKKIM